MANEEQGGLGPLEASSAKRSTVDTPSTQTPVASLAHNEAPFIAYSADEPSEPKPLGVIGPLVTWSVYGAAGEVLATGLDRQTAHLFAAAPLLREALREALGYIPKRARPVLLRQAEIAMAMADGAVVSAGEPQ